MVVFFEGDGWRGGCLLSAEAMILLRNLKIAHSRGLSNLWMESDLVQTIHSNSLLESPQGIVWKKLIWNWMINIARHHT